MILHSNVTGELLGPLPRNIVKYGHQTIKTTAPRIHDYVVKTNASQYLLFFGFIYFAVNVAIVTGYATGFIGHRLFSPSDAMTALIVLSVIISLASPLIWWLNFRPAVTTLTICMFSAMILGTILLNVIFYWLALAAV